METVAVPSAAKDGALSEGIFQVQPLWDLQRYTIRVGPEAERRVETYLNSIDTRKDIVCLHLHGNTNQNSKNLTDEIAGDIGDYILGQGYTPVVLDWDYRSRLPDQKRIFCPDTTNPLWM